MLLMRKSMKGLLTAALGLALLAPVKAGDSKNSDPPAPAKKVEPTSKDTRKAPGGGHGYRRVESRTYYRATCKHVSHRSHGWSGTRDSLAAAYRDARNHEREYRGHEATLEEVPQYPRRPKLPGPIRVKEGPGKAPSAPKKIKPATPVEGPTKTPVVN